MLTKPYLQYKIFVHCFILYILHCQTFIYTYRKYLNIQLMKNKFCRIQYKKNILINLNQI